MWRASLEILLLEGSIFPKNSSDVQRFISECFLLESLHNLGKTIEGNQGAHWGGRLNHSESSNEQPVSEINALGSASTYWELVPRIYWDWATSASGDEEISQQIVSKICRKENKQNYVLVRVLKPRQMWINDLQKPWNTSGLSLCLDVTVQVTRNLHSSWPCASSQKRHFFFPAAAWKWGVQKESRLFTIFYYQISSVISHLQK